MKYIITIALSILILSCTNNYTPKPKAYFRIDFPEKEYKKYDSLCPYVFDYPVYSEMELAQNNIVCWKNIVLPTFNAKIYLSYKKITSSDSLYKFIEDSHTLAYKHSIKADAINEQVFVNEEKNAYGMLYLIKGNAATPLQFRAMNFLLYCLP